MSPVDAGASCSVQSLRVIPRESKFSPYTQVIAHRVLGHYFFWELSLRGSSLGHGGGIGVSKVLGLALLAVLLRY